jgi:hypothetical protein
MAKKKAASGGAASEGSENNGAGTGASSATNKTHAIKDALRANPNKSPKDIAAELNQQGVEASPAYVSTIKSKMKASSGSGRKTKKSSGTTATPAAADTNDNVSLSTLVQAKKLADQLGGVEQARKMLTALSKLNA